MVPFPVAFARMESAARGLGRSTAGRTPLLGLASAHGVQEPRPARDLESSILANPWSHIAVNSTARRRW
jgi:hypothetical protein